MSGGLRFSAVIEAFVVPALNRILRRNSWALDQLKPYAGRSARFDLPLAPLELSIEPTGEVAAAPRDATPAVTMTFTPGVVLRVLARDETVWNEIPVAGDTDFATVLHHIWRNLRWDIEEDLARIFGDIAAHRMVETGRKLDRWRAQSMESVARNFAEYWTEERPLIARRADVERFNREVDGLRDDTARLEKRIERLQSTP